MKRSKVDSSPRMRALEVRLQLRVTSGGYDVLGEACPSANSRVKPRLCEEEVVHEGAAALEVDVGDRLGDVLGEEAQLLLARGELLLRAASRR